MDQKSTIPLRERKFAQTKLNLARAALGRLESVSLDSLSVAALCEAAEVSEATFFNYFPKKSDLVAYISRLWELEIVWHVRAAQGQGIAAVTAAFEQAGKQIQRYPGAMGEIISHQASLRAKPEPVELTRAERVLAFPQLDGVDAVPAGGLDGILVANLEHAIKVGELPPNANRGAVLVALVAIFYGVPLALRLAGVKAITNAYRQQLVLLWEGVRAAASRTL